MVVSSATIKLIGNATECIRDGGNREYSPLAPQRNHSPRSTVLINLLVDFCRKANSAHDAIAKLLIHNRLVGVAIVLHNFVQTVNERLHGGHGSCAATVGEPRQLGRQLLGGEVEDFAELGNVRLGGLGLAVKESGDGDFLAAEVLCDFGKGQVGLCLGVEELTGSLVLAGSFCKYFFFFRIVYALSRKGCVEERRVSREGESLVKPALVHGGGCARGRARYSQSVNGPADARRWRSI